MKIATLTGGLAGGVGQQAQLLAAEWSQRGHSVVLYTFDRPEFKPAYEVVTLPIPPWAWRHRILDLPVMLAMPGIFARQNFDEFDIIHSHTDIIGRFPVPVVRTFYGSAWDEGRAAIQWPLRMGGVVRALEMAVASRVERLSMASADVCVACSNVTRRRLMRAETVIPCGIDLVEFHALPREPTPHPTILFLGTLFGRKRGELVRRLFPSVRSRVPGAELWMVGIRGNDAEGVRYFHGLPRRDLVQMFRRAWVYCSASRFEGFGLPYVEAMAAGAAVVATPNEQVRDVLGEGQFGVLCSVSELADRLVDTLANTALRNHFESAGYERAKRYDIRHTANSYVNVFLRLLMAR